MDQLGAIQQIGRPGPGSIFKDPDGALFFVQLNPTPQGTSLVRNFLSSEHVFTVSNGTDYSARIMQWEFREQSYGWSTSFTGTGKMSFDLEGIPVYEFTFSIHQGTVECLEANNNHFLMSPPGDKIISSTINSGGVGRCNAELYFTNPPTSRTLCGIALIRVDVFVYFPNASTANVRINDNPNIQIVNRLF